MPILLSIVVEQKGTNNFCKCVLMAIFRTFISTFMGTQTHLSQKLHRQQNKLANVKKNSTDERSTTTRNNDIKEQRYLAVQN